jgi:hypothetical protein
LVRFSKFGFGSFVSGLIIIGLLIQFVYLPSTASQQYVDALVLFVVDLIKGAVNWIGIGLVITGILLFVL